MRTPAADTRAHGQWPVRAIDALTIGVLGFGIVWLASLIWGVGLLLGSPPGGAELEEPSASDRGAIEAQRVFAEEYPGWSVVDVGVRAYTKAEQPVSEYVVTAVPPDRDYSIGIAFLSGNGQSVNNTDRVFCESGPYHLRAESLWEYLDAHYAATGRTIITVRTDYRGRVQVEWQETTGSGLTARHRRVTDELMRDETAREWRQVRQ